MPRAPATRQLPIRCVRSHGYVEALAPGFMLASWVDMGARNPLAGQTVDFLLPAAYGPGGLDAHFGEPEHYGHEDRTWRSITRRPRRSGQG